MGAGQVEAGGQESAVGCAPAAVLVGEVVHELLEGRAPVEGRGVGAGDELLEVSGGVALALGHGHGLVGDVVPAGFLRSGVRQFTAVVGALREVQGLSACLHGVLPWLIPVAGLLMVGWSAEGMILSCWGLSLGGLRLVLVIPALGGVGPGRVWGIGRWLIALT